ncbi:hypothetical protein JCM18237_12590 [Halorubrum luteum]
MSVEARIKAALDDTQFEPKENGDRTKQITIPSSGLSVDEVKQHRWVEDAFLNPENENQFSVIVSTKRNLGIVRSR